MKLKLLAFLTLYLVTTIKARTPNCNFAQEWFYDYGVNRTWAPLYTCSLKVKQSNLNERFEDITGEHEDESNDRDVNRLNIFAGNEFKTFSSIFCEKFPNLKAITLNNVKLEQFEEDSLSNCTSLETLSLEGNEIPELPESLLTKNSKLTYINFETCKLVNLPENLFLNQQQLVKLSMTGNEFSYLPSNIFAPLVNLKELDLDSNLLQTIDPKWFENLQSLTWLDFDGNQIYEVPSKAFTANTNLEKLYFNNNKVKTMHADSFDGLQKLQELGMQKNELYDLPAGIFAPLINLQKLELNGNRLQTIHSDSFSIHNQLTEIYLQDNNLNSIDENLLNVTALSDINMENNTCSQLWFKKTNKNAIRRRLKKCFENYILRKYLEYNATTSCGKVTAGHGNIIGGMFVPPGASPWFAALFVTSVNGTEFFCGGSLITNRKVLTAAHCHRIKESKYAHFDTSNLTILLGAHDLDKSEEKGRVNHTAQSIHTHPDWDVDSDRYDADIAVLVLSTDVEINDYVQRICLCTPDLPIAADINGFVFGYGRSENWDKVHENLPKVVYTPIHKNDDCFFTKESLLKLSSKRTFCAGTGNNTGVCSGDSGGGLIVFNGYSYFLRGIVSSSIIGGPYKCDVNTFAVFTDVTMYIDWINEIPETDEIEIFLNHRVLLD